MLLYIVDIGSFAVEILRRIHENCSQIFVGFLVEVSGVDFLLIYPVIVYTLVIVIKFINCAVI